MIAMSGIGPGVVLHSLRPYTVSRGCSIEAVQCSGCGQINIWSEPMDLLDSRFYSRSVYMYFSPSYSLFHDSGQVLSAGSIMTADLLL